MNDQLPSGATINEFSMKILRNDEITDDLSFLYQLVHYSSRF